jgi:aldose 1-epimerase
LHGGPSALDTVLFETIKPANSILFSAAELQALKLTDYSNALFTATTSDGSNGFPGTLRIEVLFALVNPFQMPAVAPGKYADLGSALIVYRARLMESGTITPINLTQAGSYFVPL